MAQNVQIQCINKTDRMNPHERIKNVGGINAGGGNWKLTLEAAIADIKGDKWKFWTVAAGKSVWVIIAKSAQGNEYLRTENDGDQPNNLLSLPECP